jgi:hypothetical protein
MIDAFQVAVGATIERVQTVLAAPGEKPAADVTVVLRLTGGGIEDQRNAVMRFVHENDEWLILEEGM